MKLSIIILILAFFLESLSLTSAAAASTYLQHSCLKNTTFTPNSTYQSNLNILLTSLSSNASTASGFLNLTVGNPPDTSYGLFLCRGDVAASACKACVSKSSKDLPERCPGQRAAVIWYEFCMVRYSDKYIFSSGKEVPANAMWKNENVREPERFMQILGKTMNEIAVSAASDRSRKRFAVKSASFSSDQKVYTMAQCTEDLASWDCDSCLRSVIAPLPACCSGKQEVRMLTPSCNIRYAPYAFYNESRVREMGIIPLPDSDESTDKKENQSTTSRLVAIIVIPTSLILLSLVLSCFIIRKRRQKRNSTGLDMSTSVESLRFNLTTVRVATDDFSDANKLGQGGFGSVYKGKLKDGQDIAVKRLAECSVQGEQEFMNEITLISRLQHKSLVRMLGFCLEGKERILIYEFMPNGSLDHLLFDPNKSVQLDWIRRLKITNGIARGLLYLHEDSQLRVIHRDMKPGNVLLDGEMHPKISDFGMARLFGVQRSKYKTKRIVGTYGYMAPEYAKYGHISVKTDVFSFGVMVLEIVSGKRHSSHNNSGQLEHLLSYAWKNWKEGTPSNLIDQKLTRGSKREILKCIHIGLLCVQENANRRPTMASVVLMLNSSHTSGLPSPSQPGFYMHRDMESQELHSQYNSSVYEHSSQCTINDVTITDPFPR